nr:integrase, catalytic region, zinc finger, CCHC-type, peptidase aspartic, catalytic [Tanacetum cinerariifolium]
MMILEKLSLHEEIHEVDHHEKLVFLVILKNLEKCLKNVLVFVLMEYLLIEHLEPKNFNQAMTGPSWIDAMQEEILEFERLQVWELVPYPDKVILIKLRWIYKVKTDEFGRVLKNKARLVAQGFRQEEGIDFEESFKPLSLHEEIHEVDHHEKLVFLVILKNLEKCLKNVLVFVLMEYLLIEHLGKLILIQENWLNVQLLVQQRLGLEKQQLMED